MGCRQRPPHRSGRARLRHPAPQLTVSLQNAHRPAPAGRECAAAVPSCGALCASSATCRSFVEMVSGLDVPAICPSCSSVMPTPPFPPPAPHGMGFPASLVLRRRSDSRSPVTPHFVASCGATALASGDHRASQVPGEPRCAHALLSDPGESATSGPLQRCGIAFRI
jgi:hypothetical protein